MSKDVVLRGLLLSEDRSARAVEVLRNLLLRMFERIDGAVPAVAVSRFGLEAPESAEERLGAHPDWWGSTGDGEHKAWVAMNKAVATALLASRPVSFVFLHFDGERAWSRRDESDREQRFELRVRGSVREILTRARSRPTADAVEAALARLIPLVSYPCVEAWTYQNTARARALCVEQKCQRGAEHEQLLAAWETDRGLLDERVDVAEVLTCIQKDWNSELTGPGYPTEAAIAAGKSFAAAAARVTAHAELRALVLAALPAWRQEQRRYEPDGAGADAELDSTEP